jgi:hypothetical protein
MASVRKTTRGVPGDMISGQGKAGRGEDMSSPEALIPVVIAAAQTTEGIGTGRLLPTVAALLGLVGVVLGSLALRAARRATGNGRGGAITAGVAGLVALVVGVLHSASSAGGLGTGNGLAGAVLAMVIGVTAMALGGLALARSRRVPA